MSTALHFTNEEYGRMVALGVFDHLNRKIELIYGEIREVNPAGPVHDDLITYLTDLLPRVSEAILRCDPRMTAKNRQ